MIASGSKLTEEDIETHIIELYYGMPRIYRP